VQQAQGDLAAALASYRASLAIRERLAKADPGNAGWQRDLSVSFEKIGDVQQAQGDLAAALTSFRASLDIAERLAKADPGNAGWQRDLIVSLFKIGDLSSDKTYFARALEVALDMQRRGILAPRDGGMIGVLQRRAVD
jgi:tetratricopeptide (TPR) repeat protein